MIDRAFAQALRRCRQERGLSQEAFAELVGLHRTYVSQLERGLKSPSLRTIFRITTVLNISLSDFASLIEQEARDVFSE